MEKVIVTGATGYLGSCITKMLVYNGMKVLCIKRKNSQLSRLLDVSKDVDFIDIENTRFDKNIKEFKPDIVIHTACIYDRNNVQIKDLVEANYIFPASLLDLCVKSGLKFWLNTGTSLPKALNAYSLTKHQFSEMGDFYNKKFGVSFCNVLLEHFYGENDNESKFISWAINKLINNEDLLLTDGTQKRDFIYIDDVIDAYKHILKVQPKGVTSIPLGSGVAPSIREVVEYLKDIIGSKSNINFGAVTKRENEPALLIADITKIEEYGYHCKYNWREGMKKLVQEELK